MSARIFSIKNQEPYHAFRIAGESLEDVMLETSRFLALVGESSIDHVETKHNKINTPHMWEIEIYFSVNPMEG